MSEQTEAPKQGALKSLFDGLSISQVAAGALAAVTSMLLSAQIGIAGSVIGVAVGSVVSTVSSQLYKKFLAGSAEKIRGLASNGDEQDEASAEAGAQTQATANPAAATVVLGGMPTAANASAETQAFRAAETTLMPTQGAATTKFDAAATSQQQAAETRVIGSTAIPAEGQSNTPHINSAAGHTGNASHATGVIKLEAEKKRTMQRRVLAVSVASSIVAILLFAGLVLMFTGGEGLGTKVVPFTGETVTSQLADESDAPQEDVHGSSAATQQNQSATNNNSSTSSNESSNSQQNSSNSQNSSSTQNDNSSSTSNSASSNGTSSNGTSSSSNSSSSSNESGTSGSTNDSSTSGSSSSSSNSSNSANEGSTSTGTSGSSSAGSATGAASTSSGSSS